MLGHITLENVGTLLSEFVQKCHYPVNISIYVYVKYYFIYSKNSETNKHRVYKLPLLKHNFKRNNTLYIIILLTYF